jgi:hypothetical protein
MGIGPSGLTIPIALDDKRGNIDKIRLRVSESCDSLASSRFLEALAFVKP